MFHNRHSVSAVMQMNDLDVLETFLGVVGVGKISGPYQDKRFNRQPSFRWGSYGKDAVYVINLFMPFFGHRRRAKGQEMLDWIAESKGKGWFGDSEGHRTSANVRWSSRT